MSWRKVGGWLQSAGVTVLAVVLLPWWIGKAELLRRRDPRTLAEVIMGLARIIDDVCWLFARDSYVRRRSYLRRRAARLIRRGLHTRLAAAATRARAS